MSDLSRIKSSRIREAKETFQAILELSNLLHTGLDAESLSICVRLCEAGVNPEVLAMVVRELQKETQITNARTEHEHERTKNENARNIQ